MRPSPVRPSPLARLVPLALAASLVAPLAACGGGSGTAARPDASVARAGVDTAGPRSAAGESRYARYSNMEDMFAHISGLTVTQVAGGEGYTIRIRGIQGNREDGEPLLVLDGLPVHSGNYASALAGISPRDVMRVDVLKDPAQTNFYGLAGVYGVIVVTTRKAQ